MKAKHAAGAPEVLSPLPRGFARAMEELGTACTREEQESVVERVLRERMAPAAAAPAREDEWVRGADAVARLERACNAVEHILRSCVRRRASPRRLGEALRTFTDGGGGESLRAYIVRRWSEAAPALLEGGGRRAARCGGLPPRLLDVRSAVGLSVGSDGGPAEPTVQLRLRVRGGGGAACAEEELTLRLPQGVLRELLDTQCGELVAAVQAARASG